MLSEYQNNAYFLARNSNKSCTFLQFLFSVGETKYFKQNLGSFASIKLMILHNKFFSHSIWKGALLLSPQSMQKKNIFLTESCNYQNIHSLFQ
jgi:hypothetical protein